MAEIIFQNKEDASQFHFFLEKQLQSFALPKKFIFLKEDSYFASVHIDKSVKGALDACKKAFLHFIYKIKLNDWFKKILKEHYFFEDEEEQEQIIEIIRSIIEGNRRELETLIPQLNIAKEMEKAVFQIFEEQLHFSFDSFVKFRMRPLLEQLETFVEISIDEYKMEQEYQVFIQTLRQFLAGRQTKMHSLHLIIDESITFYNDMLQEISKGEIAKLIDRRLLSNHPVYVDSVTIAPLLSIAPENIFLYTKDDEHPLVRTIINIFEERVHLKGIDEFSYHKRA